MTPSTSTLTSSRRSAAEPFLSSVDAVVSTVRAVDLEGPRVGREPRDPAFDLHLRSLARLEVGVSGQVLDLHDGGSRACELCLHAHAVGEGGARRLDGRPGPGDDKAAYGEGRGREAGDDPLELDLRCARKRFDARRPDGAGGVAQAVDLDVVRHREVGEAARQVAVLRPVVDVDRLAEHLESSGGCVHGLDLPLQLVAGSELFQRSGAVAAIDPSERHHHAVPEVRVGAGAVVDGDRRPGRHVEVHAVEDHAALEHHARHDDRSARVVIASGRAAGRGQCDDGCQQPSPSPCPCSCHMSPRCGGLSRCGYP